MSVEVRIKNFNILNTGIIEIDTKIDGVVIRNFVDYYKDGDIVSVDNVMWLIIDGKKAAISQSFCCINNKLKFFEQ